MSFDFATVEAPFRMQPGLRRLAPGGTQLHPNAPDAPHFAAKLAALRDHAGNALLAVPGHDPTPALRAVMRQAVAEHPTAFAFDGDAGFTARALGWSVSGTAVQGDGPAAIGQLLDDLAPAWRLPALLALSVEEDLALIDGRSARLPWLAVCLPSRWAPEDKIGRHFAEVHAPVPDSALLRRAGDHLARLVTGETRWARDVWTVTPDPSLMQHPAHRARPPWPDDLATASFRTEDQTFLPLPDRQEAVFTIRVASRPLGDAVTGADAARRLHDAVASMSPAVLDYRGLAPVHERLLAWLAARAA